MTDLPAATRARLERTLANAEAHGALLPVLTTDMRGLLTAYDALRAAQAQAAPVLAAADRLHEANTLETWTNLHAAVMAWRAARGE